MRLKGLKTLVRSKDFQHNRQCGVSYFSKSLILQVSNAHEQVECVHVGFVVSKKVGCAVKRNLIKRRLRAIAQKLLIKQDINKSYVFVAKRNSAYATFSELNRDTLFCLKKSAKPPQQLKSVVNSLASNSS